MRLLLKSLALLLGALVFFVLVGVAATWESERPVEDLKARWAQAPSRFVAPPGLAGLSVHVRDEGPDDDPLPIVLLHGTSASLHTWDGWAAALRGQRRVVRFDLPGFGLTGPSADADYSIAAYVRFVTATLDALGVRRLVLAGNSLGGEIAWATALALPERVSRLVLVDAAGYPLDSASRPIDVPLGFQLARMKVLAPLLKNTLPRGVVQSSLRDLYGDPSRVTPELVDRYFELALRQGNRRALGQRMDHVMHTEPERIKLVRQPTLILWGGRDRLLPPEFGERFARDIAGSRLVRFEALGHVPHEEDPAATVAALRAFLAPAP
jgi:pimeloyl-ACP methyl ester carboxylesterase